MEVSSKALRKVRQSAIKAKTAISCVSCLAYGNRCSTSRPCSRCIKSAKRCFPAVDATIFQMEVMAPASSHLVIEDPKASPDFVGLKYWMSGSSSTKNKACDLGFCRLNQLDCLNLQSPEAAAATVAVIENNKVHKDYEPKDQNRAERSDSSVPFVKKDSSPTAEPASARIAIRKLVDDDEGHRI